jgi:F0F1-type ATP synthase assembly protein I
LTALSGLGLGYWLDRKWGTTPLFLLVGFFVGAVLGMVQLARRMK